MWSVLFIMLFCMAVLFWIIALKYESNPFWNITSIMLSCIIWLILSLSNMVIEFPYVAIQSDDTIVTGVYTYTSSISPFLVYLFLGFFILSFIYLLVMIWDKWYNYKNWHGDGE